MITFSHKGNFNKTEKFLNGARKINFLAILNRYGVEGVNALSSATPIDSGLTAASWGYKIEIRNGNYVINWFNTNINDGVIIAVLIQYGHGTSGGTFVQGIDYINPAIRSVFDKLVEALWKEVSSL